MKAAGVTIRRMTLVQDALQKQRAFHEWDLAGDLTDERVADTKKKMAKLDTEIAKLGKAIIGLTEVYAAGWLDKPADAVVRSVIRQAVNA